MILPIHSTKSNWWYYTKSKFKLH